MKTIAVMMIKQHIKNITGFKWKTGDRLSFTWGEINLHFTKPKKWSLGFWYRSDDGFDEDDKGCLAISPIFVSIYIGIKSKIKYDYATQKTHRYGFDLYEWESITFHLGPDKRKTFRFPFVNWNWHSTEYINPETNEITFVEDKNTRKLKWLKSVDKSIQSADEYNFLYELKDKISKTSPYQYVLRNGDVQNTTATYYVSNMIWSRKGFPFLKKSKRYIDIIFADEIGEEVDSWKGGCIGCSWEIKLGMTAEEALRDMERNRKFER